MREARMLGIWLWAVLGLSIPGTAFAAEASVHLKNGGVVHGQLMEVQPNASVRLRMADGEVREIPWAEVARIDDGSLSKPTPQASATSGSGSGSAPPELLELQRQRAEINDGGPAVMMIVGGVAFLILTPIGLGLFALDAACSSTNSTTLSHTCAHVQGPAIVFTVLGLGGGAIAIWGFIKLLNNGSERERIDLRIRELQERKMLSLDMVPQIGGGELRLSLRF